MNIQEAKAEICNTLRAYLAKDENGYYTYPLIRQRPLLLIGPAGNRQNCHYGTGGSRVRCGTCSLHHYPSHPSECHRSSGDR